MINLAKKNLFFIVIGIAAVLFLFVFNDKPEQENTVDVKPIEAASIKEPATVQETTDAYVDVKGEVKSPGVYEVSVGSRVEDVITLAGGFTEKANQSVINLAQKVHDEMIILVPKAGELVDVKTEGSTNSTKINLNYAKQEEIEQLNGIGPSKAQAIIQYREENGLFQTMEDVLNVPGIGEKTLENMKESIQIP
ncbi:helix-hairpin-helix domain-containing protein [Virgibacillus necropolis]|uniref:Competence protein ComEA n=1 Tax=Virgibacillus necropolis TaxID=163877 RepID=A0A221MC29_9BACI|nr:helix-hairpin-helix domain-containing protein [Virgibacillus necropolis]ASN05170.1 competence protein ComEA [Virgibacillus necropolis]